MLSVYLLLNLTGGLITCSGGCHGSTLATTDHVTSDHHLVLASDGVKYASVTVGEDADRDEVIPEQSND